MENNLLMHRNMVLLRLPERPTKATPSFSPASMGIKSISPGGVHPVCFLAWGAPFPWALLNLRLVRADAPVGMSDIKIDSPVVPAAVGAASFLSVSFVPVSFVPVWFHNGPPGVGALLVVEVPTGVGEKGGEEPVIVP